MHFDRMKMSLPLAVFFAASSISPALACAPAHIEKSFRVKFAEHEAVFFGRVEHISDVIDRGDGTQQPPTHNMTVTFKILHMWKGDGQKTYDLHFSWVQDKCGEEDNYPFKQGWSYVMFAPWGDLSDDSRYVWPVGDKSGDCPIDNMIKELDNLSGKNFADDISHCNRGKSGRMR